MRNRGSRIVPSSRATRVARLAALFLLGFGCWILNSSAAIGAAEIVAVQPTRIADLVLLRGGFAAGLRQGMVCRVTRGSTEIAEVLLVDLRQSCSAALIVNVAPRQSIRAGDIATIKILKS